MKVDQVSKRLQVLAISETLAMAQKSRELRSQGFDIIDLSLGEPDFNTPEHIKEAGVEAIRQNFTHYSPVPGYLDLRQAIVTKMKRDSGLDFTADQVVVSNGAKQSIGNVLLSTVDPGDEVIMPAPYWVSYPEIIKMAEGKAVVVNAGIEQNFKITAGQLEAAITPKTRAFLFSSPSNPTGEIYSRSELSELAAVFEKHPQILIISDEIYECINYDGKHQSITQFEPIRDRVAIINGVSKGYAMTGWRIGYMVGPLWLAIACQKLQGHYTSGASSIAQKASIAGLIGDQSAIKIMVAEFKSRRDLVVKRLSAIPGVRTNNPPGAFYVLPDVTAFIGKSDGQTLIASETDLVLYLLHEAHVAMVSGSAFGAPGCIRISFSTSQENINKAIDRIAGALSRLK
ncbi:MAG: pyridoxal phosphate-dependent aminotransferase [Porphyromonadaceae bacterium]|nr:MAG: pyridoxal phosphate-dependent aminotransferase [Porphyromonadaceae bacterium]